MEHDKETESMQETMFENAVDIPIETTLFFSNSKPCYENCESIINKTSIRCQIVFSIMFRRFDKTLAILRNIEQSKIDSLLTTVFTFNGADIMPSKCAKWNFPYICAYDEKYNTNLAQKLENAVLSEDSEFPIFEYDQKISDKFNVFSLFFNNIQLMLDVRFYEKQMLAAKQVKQNGISLIADEVGTGKTVSALYAICDVINELETRKQKAHILIVCPRNKRLDWQSDIRRQLGRYSHIVEQGDNGLLYESGLKDVFFRGYEHKIFICGPTQGQDKNGSRSSLKGSLENWDNNNNWDLAIIDEGHNLFKNYTNIKADRCIIMTATPIVVNSQGIINFNDYISLLGKVTNQQINTKITPIICNNPDEKNIHVNWFREDMGLSSAERTISFISCERHDHMLPVFYKLAHDIGVLPALHYAQDDDYLFRIARERYEIGDLPTNVINHKLNKLIEKLKESQKSYIVFCEHIEVVQNIFDNLKNVFTETVIALKSGKKEAVSLIEKPSTGQLIDSLMQVLRDKKRVIFITTGKTGGTGLNLGEFDGVIHYELPFTSIELEQRYGRVDRMDKTIKSTKKDMIFMLNSCDENENDFERNRMLYYCTRKIDATCKYMPIRNTVLFYPEFIKRNSRKILEALAMLEENPILSEENENKMDKLNRTKGSYTSKITQISAWKEVRAEDEKSTVLVLCQKLLKGEKLKNITDEQYNIMKEYVTFEGKNKGFFNEYAIAAKQFREHKKTTQQWLGILGAVELDFNSDVFDAIPTSSDNEDEDKIPEYLETHIDEDYDEEQNKQVTTIKQQVIELAGKVCALLNDNLQLSNRLSNGVFWYADGRIQRATVEEYRAMEAKI